MNPPLFSPAKINLCLNVHGCTRSGMHVLSSLVGFANFGDVIIARPGTKDHLGLSGKAARGLDGDMNKNLIGQAITWLRHGNVHTQPIACHLDKIIPHQSGLGGGSSNAATILRAAFTGRKAFEDWCHKTYGPVNESLLSLGADVPVCLEAKSAWMNNHGEHITAVTDIPECGIVVLVPPIGLATRDVFAAWQTFHSQAPGPIALDQQPTSFSTYDDLVTYLRDCKNDLTRAACGLNNHFSSLVREWNMYDQFDYRAMSGSGSALFGLIRGAPDPQHIRDLDRETRNPESAWYQSRLLVGRLNPAARYLNMWGGLQYGHR